MFLLDEYECFAANKMRVKEFLWRPAERTCMRMSEKRLLMVKLMPVM